ncbi:MAG: hypothetical protein CVU17_11785 [Betaproteobacteria bacterium HGW-Betaproteobacteria-11]|nr:MAG: hypothetical protein CVU17_11785 [Betaproteobacteria bacterium HGW-Betaproteobacteria-11]
MPLVETDPASALAERWLSLSTASDIAPPLVTVTLLPIFASVVPVEIATAIEPATATFLPEAPAMPKAVSFDR